MVITEASLTDTIHNLEQLQQALLKIGLGDEVTKTIAASLQATKEYRDFLAGNK